MAMGDQGATQEAHLPHSSKATGASLSIPHLPGHFLQVSTTRSVDMIAFVLSANQNMWQLGRLCNAFVHHGKRRACTASRNSL